MKINSIEEKIRLILGEGVTEIKFIDEGNLNYVYKIKLGSEVYYYKQAQSDYRKKSKWMEQLPLKKDRLKNEVKAIGVLEEIFGKSQRFVLPNVIYFNEKENIAIFKDVEKERNLLKAEIDGGEINLQHLDLAGEFIGYQHNLTAGKDITIRQGIEEGDFFEGVIYFRTVLSAHNIDARTREKVENEFEKIAQNDYKPVLINGDYSPKQIFADSNSVGVCDLEFVCLGDPAYDVGFFLAHYRLAGIINPALAEISKKAQKRFIESYFAQTAESDQGSSFKERIDFYIGTGMLNRIDGVPREWKLSSSMVLKIREKAKELINECRP